MYELFGIGSNYCANMLFGTCSNPDDMRHMTEEQLRARDARLFEMMRPATITLEMGRRMQNSSLVRRPTMTLSEWDEARAKFGTRYPTNPPSSPQAPAKPL